MVEPMPGIVAFGWALIVAFAVVILGLAFVIIWTAWFFNRAGEKWWKALIPIYSTITLLQILELPLWMIILCFLPYISVGMGIFLIVKIVEWFGKHPKTVAGPKEPAEPEPKEQV